MYKVQYFRWDYWKNWKYYLGVTFDNKLKFDDHINNEISTAYQMLGMLGIVKKNFICLTPDNLVVLYKSIIRSRWQCYLVMTF